MMSTNEHAYSPSPNGSHEPQEQISQDRAFNHIVKVLEGKARVHDGLGITLQRMIPKLKEYYQEKRTFSVPLFDQNGEVIKDPEKYNPFAEMIVAIVNDYGSGYITAKTLDVGPLKVAAISFGAKS